MSKPFHSGRFLRGPLFDRLVDREPSRMVLGASPKTLDREELKASVRNELNNILNSRCSFPEKAKGAADKSIINYGLPDFSAFDPTSQKSRDGLIAMVAQIIKKWEPRLTNIKVSVDENALEDREFAPFRLNLIVQATLLEEVQKEPVTFHLALNDTDKK